MKWFVRIFCLYLFALACLPCNDGEHGHDAIPGGGETAIIASNHNCPTHEHCNDLCSPFCTCACCGSATFTAKLGSFKLKPLPSEGSRVEFSYQSAHPTGHLSALLRPPIYKLG